MAAKLICKKAKSRKLQPGDLELVQRVYRMKKTFTKEDGKVSEYRYWVGSYSQDGTTYNFHIGKTLPAQLERLLTERTLSPGARQYNWPDSRHDRFEVEATRDDTKKHGKFRAVRYHGKEVENNVA